ncbi:phosphoadenosine phosphosulfate reductase [Pyrolobus fumarii 1A]|uniref:Phosphoadenosine phosphosulfate reductase n=1 Tax=Pyrolobus fumarii (strain DSM 11204 / 1A) TaxID=694429 RepID=G0EDP0_PYRF1|nr:phosphoadenosine phosphosulfate reductase family protein [Pyrolobus fumarii]AEM37877.1 phosphoadenosine phosphosulfate reductase [Pyrolobus fumarii 1A]
MRSFDWIVAERLARLRSESSGLHVYYDLEGNVPYFKYSYAARNASKLVDLCSQSRLWCDPRPAVEQDYKILEDALKYTFGDEVFAKRVADIARRGLSLINTDSDGVLDQMWEWFVNGVRLAIVYYDYFRGSFIAIPGPGLALLMEREGLGGRAIRESPVHAKPRGIDESGVYLVEDNGRVVGVAVGVAGSSVARIVETWDVVPDERLVLRGGSILDAYKANLGHIEMLIEKVRRVVEWLEGRLGKRGVLGLSGGKDSLLALHLLVEAGSNAQAFYSHIEHGDPPHIPSLVERTASRLGVKVVIHENEWEYVKRMTDAFGMPVRGYRWCTQVFKIAPLMSYLRRLGRDSIVSYTGSRSYETLRRGLKPATYVDVEHGVLVHAVPYKWPRFLEMLALRYYFRAEVPPDYDQGFERISCVMCPNKSVYELRLAERLYPDDFVAWRPYIEDASRRISPFGWRRVAELHAWRLALQPRDLRDIARLAGVEIIPRLPGPRRPPRRADRNDIERAARVASKILGAKRVEERVFTLGGCKAIIEDEHGVWLEKGHFGSCALLLKTLYAATYCVECKVCVNKCPVDAIRLPLDVDEKCKAPECKICVETCPLAWGAVDLGIANLVLGYRRALARLRAERERKGEEYVSKAKRAEEEVYRTKEMRDATERGNRGGEEAR